MYNIILDLKLRHWKIGKSDKILTECLRKEKRWGVKKMLMGFFC